MKRKTNKHNGTSIRLQVREKPVQGEKLERIYSLLIESASNEKTKTQNPRPSPPPSTKSTLQESLPIRSNINQVNKGQSFFNQLQISASDLQP